MAELSSPAAALLAAADRARLLHGRATVVKLGGSALEHPAAAAGTLRCLAALATLGFRLVVVHGGGKPIDRAMEAANITPLKIQGRRYTDDQTLAIVVRVLAEINADLVRKLDVPAVGFADWPVFPLRGERLLLPGLDLQPVDLGRVGSVTRVDTATLTGLLPVLPSLARDSDGGWLNVNADTAAAAVAGAIRAESVLFLTDTPGVLTDLADPSSRLDRLTRAECDELIERGIIAGGMIPKVEACLSALDAGAARAVILDGREPDALLRDFASVSRPGTEIVS